MADVGVYILLGLLLGVALAIIVSIWYLQKKKQPDFDKLNNEIYRVATSMSNELQKLFSTLQLKSTATGAFGEKIAEVVLSQLPQTSLETQYKPKDASDCRIDFVVRLPNSKFLIPIDSKFTIPEDFDDIENLHFDKENIKKLNEFAIKRAKKVVKYIKSKETTDFALMYIPDFVFSILNSDTFDTLAKMKIVPTNTSGLLSTVFMINMQNRFVTLNDEASKFSEVQMKASEGLKSILKTMTNGLDQIQHCQANISKSICELTSLRTMIDTLEIQDVNEND